MALRTSSRKIAAADIGSDVSGLSRAQLVYLELQKQIRAGGFKPGQRMREVEIADRLGVSRTPVREALNRLISDGLLEVHPLRGLSVAELNKQQVLELYGLREFLEGAAARFAAQHASVPEINTLRDMLEDSRKLDPEDADAHARLNKVFHTAIGDAGHNRYLQNALARLADSLGLVPGTTFEAKGRSADVYHEHLAILDAIGDRDPERAEASAREHIRKAGEVRLVLLFGAK